LGLVLDKQKHRKGRMSIGNWINPMNNQARQANIVAGCWGNAVLASDKTLHRLAFCNWGAIITDLRIEAPKPSSKCSSG